ncbi:hypothetical protein [Zavarzinella formosa]|uniref:hypothetical protein n=1 Tax=Zavarzinella formosa TaxID=360055 RepID=UPI0002D9F8D2|nr:hypothetical protein [Zavarzinella formosa]
MPGFDDEDLNDDRPRRRPVRGDDDQDDYDDDRPRGGRYKPHRGAMILVFGILALVMCGAFGIAAWLMGKNDLREIEDGRMDPEGKSLTQVGYILGIVGSIIFCLQLLLFVGYFALVIIIIATK